MHRHGPLIRDDNEMLGHIETDTTFPLHAPDASFLRATQTKQRSPPNHRTALLPPSRASYKGSDSHQDYGLRPSHSWVCLPLTCVPRQCLRLPIPPSLPAEWGYGKNPPPSVREGSNGIIHYLHVVCLCQPLCSMRGCSDVWTRCVHSPTVFTIQGVREREKIKSLR